MIALVHKWTMKTLTNNFPCDFSKNEYKRNRVFTNLTLVWSNTTPSNSNKRLDVLLTQIIKNLDLNID